MIDAILAVWIGFEAYRRKFWRLLPVCVLVLLYEAADVGWIRVSELISMEGTIKKLILLFLVVFVFMAWRKGQAKLPAVLTCALAYLTRLAWKPVRGHYLDAVQQPEAEYVGLAAGFTAWKLAFDAAVGILLIVTLVLLLRSVRKVPLERDC